MTFKEKKQLRYAAKMKKSTEKIKKKRSFWSLLPVRLSITFLIVGGLLSFIFLKLRATDLLAKRELAENYVKKLDSQVRGYVSFTDGGALNLELKSVTGDEQWVANVKILDRVLPMALSENGYWGIFDYNDNEWLTELSEDRYVFQMTYKHKSNTVTHVYDIAKEQNDLVKPYMNGKVRVGSNFYVHSGYVNEKTLYIERYSIGVDGEIYTVELGDMFGYDYFVFDSLPDYANEDPNNYDEAAYWNGLSGYYGKMGSLEINSKACVFNASVYVEAADGENSPVSGSLNRELKEEAKEKLDGFVAENKEGLIYTTLDSPKIYMDTFTHERLNAFSYWYTGNVVTKDNSYGIVFVLTDCGPNIIYYFLGVLAIGIVLTLTISLLWTRAAYLKYKIQHDIYEYRTMIANTMAHDLKSPLMAISGYVDNLLDNTNPDKNEHYLKEISRKTSYMNGLIENTLELSKSEELLVNKKEQLDITECIKEMQLAFAEQIVQKKLEVNIEGTKHILCDKNAMKTVLRNIFENAIKYSNENGRIDIALKNDRIIFRNTCKELKTDVSRLFEAYIKDDNSRTGTKGNGLGLAIVKSICDAHGYTTVADYKNGSFEITIANI